MNVDNKKHKCRKIMVCLHAGLLLWALLFLGSVFILDNGTVAGMLAIGNVLFLFVNIPFALFTLVLKKKGYFDAHHNLSIVILSILNIIVGIAAWFFVALLFQKF